MATFISNEAHNYQVSIVDGLLYAYRDVLNAQQ